MNKGQSPEKIIKDTLKFLKLNESSFSTAIGGVVVFGIALMIFNYFKSTNLKTWQDLLSSNEEPTVTEEVKPTLDSETIAVYKVVKGDDLWHISEKYYKSGYNYVDIMKANNMTTGVIEPDMEIKIPNVEAKKITTVDEVMETPEIKEEVVNSNSGVIDPASPTEIKQPVGEVAVGGEYTVVKGDCYWDIAVKAYGDGYAWTKIYEANKDKFSDPNVIYVGVLISIPSLK